MKGIQKRPTHRRHDSGELEVFEAAKYFSGTVNSVGFTMIRDERLLVASGHHADMKTSFGYKQPVNKDNYKLRSSTCKQQPSSPAASKLASFLNSFFQHHHQSRRSVRAPSLRGEDDDDESSHGARRKTRSSMSLSGSIRSCDSKYIYSSAASSCFRSSTTPAKPIQKSIALIRPQTDQSYWEDKKAIINRVKSVDGFFDKDRAVMVVGENKWVLNKANTTAANAIKGYRSSFRRTEEEEEKVDIEDGMESDTSSDLFELRNFDDHHVDGDASSINGGLPVYGTTNAEIIINRRADSGTAVY